MIDAAAKKIVVTDHTKIGRRALYTFLPIDQIDLLITDNQTDKKLIDEMYKNGIIRIEVFSFLKKIGIYNKRSKELRSIFSSFFAFSTHQAVSIQF